MKIVAQVRADDIVELAKKELRGKMGMKDTDSFFKIFSGKVIVKTVAGDEVLTLCGAQFLEVSFEI